MGGQQVKPQVTKKVADGESSRISRVPPSLWVIAEDLVTESSTDFYDSQDSHVFIALYDFQEKGENQLGLKKGEKVKAKEWDESQEWCLATNMSNISGYVPTKYLAPLTSLDKYTWYHGPISRSAAEYLLRSEIDGTFVVRESESSPGQFSITLKYGREIFHYRISEDKQGFGVSAEDRFKSIPDLVQYYAKEAAGLVTSLKYAVPRTMKPTIYDVCPGLPDKWELDRTELNMLGKLGSGQYGDVYKANLGQGSKSERLVAVKTLKKDSASVEDFAKESALMKNMKHPNLVQLLGVCSKRDPLYMVMEFMVNGNLLEFLRTSSSDDLQPTILLYMATQIGSAMMYLESKNFIHRDLAARNCLVGENHVVKVADFGLARVIKEETYESQSTSVLPIKWTAPEGLTHSIFSSKSDVWAFGILLYEMVTHGETPYPSLTIADVYPFLESGRRMDIPPKCPSQVYQLMRQCWEWETEKRPTFKEIHSRLDDIVQSSSINKGRNQVSDQDTNDSRPAQPKIIPTDLPSSKLEELKKPLSQLPPVPPHNNQTKKPDNSVLRSRNSDQPPVPSKMPKSNSLGRSPSDGHTPIDAPLQPSLLNPSFKNELSQKICSSNNNCTDYLPNTVPPVTKTKNVVQKPMVLPPTPPVSAKPASAGIKPSGPPPLPPNKPPKSVVEASSTQTTKKAPPAPPGKHLKYTISAKNS